MQSTLKIAIHVIGGREKCIFFFKKYFLKAKIRLICPSYVDMVTNFSKKSAGTDVMFFKLLSPKKWAKNWWALLTQNKAKLCKILIIILVFEKNASFFHQKLSKIAENCGHNINPR
jgi:hypothetical protein